MFPAIHQTDAPRSRPLHPRLLCKALRISVQSEMGWSGRAATERGSQDKTRQVAGQITVTFHLSHHNSVLLARRTCGHTISALEGEGVISEGPVGQTTPSRHCAAPLQSRGERRDEVRAIIQAFPSCLIEYSGREKEPRHVGWFPYCSSWPPINMRVLRVRCGSSRIAEQLPVDIFIIKIPPLLLSTTRPAAPGAK